MKIYRTRKEIHFLLIFEDKKKDVDDYIVFCCPYDIDLNQFYEVLDKNIKDGLTGMELYNAVCKSCGCKWDFVVVSPYSYILENNKFKECVNL